MTCRFCGRRTHGPWFYCDADCERDHQTELDAQEEPSPPETPDDDTDLVTYDRLTDADAQFATNAVK